AQGPASAHRHHQGALRRLHHCHAQPHHGILHRFAPRAREPRADAARAHRGRRAAGASPRGRGAFAQGARGAEPVIRIEQGEPMKTIAALLALFLASAAYAQQEPLRVGFLTVRTGPLAAGGRQMEEGINLFLRERNNTLAGRKVEITFADTAGQPAQAKSKAQELVERDKVHLLVGPLATFEALALDDYVLQAKVP